MDFKSNCSITTFVLKQKILLNGTIFLLTFDIILYNVVINIDRLYSESLDHHPNNFKDLKKTQHVSDKLFPMNNKENWNVCI